MNNGTAVLIMKVYGISSTQNMVDTLSYKKGGFSIYLGLMLFVKLFLFFRGKRKAGERRAEEILVR